MSNQRFVHVHPHTRVTARNARAHAPHVHMHVSPTVTGSPSGRSGHRSGLGQGMLAAGWNAHLLNAPGKFRVVITRDSVRAGRP